MKSIICLFTVLIFFGCNDDTSMTEVVDETTSYYPFSDPQNLNNWELQNSLSDEFNQSSLDLNKWVDLYPGWNGRFPSWFVSNNVVVNEGELNIIMKKEYLIEMGNGYEYTTGVIRSTSAYKYGYSEVKAKCMNSAGSSAFFLNNVQADWWTEIDVFEIGGNAVGYEYIINTNLHEFYNPSNVITPFVFNINTHYSDAYSPTSVWRPDSDYHIYGIEWNEDLIKWYVDGNLIRETSNTRWHQELFVNIDSEVMQDWLGLPEENDLPSIFHIDYVRTWQALN